MGEALQVYGTSLLQIRIYYIFVFLAFIYLVVKYRNKFFIVFVILLFFNGLFSFVGKGFHDIFKIAITALTFYWLLRTKALFNKNLSIKVPWAFLFLSITFFISANLNDDYFTIIFSQYSRYFILISLFLILFKYRNSIAFKIQLDRALIDILWIQILLSVIKLFIMGPRESLVGSVSSQGGALATLLPMAGLIFLWLQKKSVFKQNDWIFIIGLLFIGFMSVKRAIWFIMPLLFAALIFYVPKRKIPSRIIVTSIIIIPLIFYFGVRLNKTLNEEHKIWGTFNLDFVIDYAINYSFGNGEDIWQTNTTKGRGSATVIFFDKLINDDITPNDFWGNGLRDMYATNFKQFAELDYDIVHKGSATGIYQTFIANGYIGVLAMILFALSLISTTSNRRFRNVLLVFFFWDYLFYTGIIFREYALSFLFCYAIVYSRFLHFPTRNLQLSPNANENI